VVLAAIAFNPVGENTSSIPAPAPQAGEVVTRVIDYTYDPLYRLTGADYDDGTFFHYTYDAVGNRITQETLAGTNNYVYDIANRLIEVDGVSYTWDANGNLLSDGTSSYSYNHANRLVGVSQGGDAYTFGYNGQGDSLQQTVNGDPTTYTLDLNTGLTQVLVDGTNAYLYGLGRIGEEQPDGWLYHLPDALGSVRQLANNAGTIDLAKAYTPFGSVSTELGEVSSPYGFTGEWVDGTGLTFLRERYLDNGVGRFISKDSWEGNILKPMSYVLWVYVYNNPINLLDPSGLCEGSGYKYCRVLGGPYDGAIIDLDHFDASKRIAKKIKQGILKEEGKDPGFLALNEPQAGILNLTRYYETHIALNTPKPILDRINLGIFMDFQWNIETLQSIPCYAGIPCSGFANEDLASDYLGFVVEVLMPKNSSLGDILNKLGAEGGEPTNDPGLYKSDWIDTIKCFKFFDCGDFNPYNMSCDWAFKLFVEDTGKYLNRPWPAEFQMKPIKRGYYWEPSTLFLFEFSLIR
jgi:RHS repeat-associated protein